MKNFTPNTQHRTPNKLAIFFSFCKVITLFIMLFFSCKEAKAQFATTYWYNYGIADSVFYQTDVFSFRCFGGIAYGGSYDTTIVDSIVYRGSRSDKANDVFFKSNTTLLQRITEAQNIYWTNLVETVYINVSEEPGLNYSSNEWLTIDDLILVNFTDPYPTSTFLTSFMSQYNLTLYYEPLAGLPTTTGCSYTYVFRAHITEDESGLPNFNYFVDLMREMYANSNGTVYNAGPNFVNHSPTRDAVSGPANPQPASPIYTMCANSSPNDTWADYQWYISNDGFNETDLIGNCSGTNPANGTVGADAKICDCWDQELTGDGITVGVAARGDVIFDHPDLPAQSFSIAWDCTNPPCVALVPTTPTGAGMHMNGIIAGEKDNNLDIAGIAYKSTLMPFKIGDDFSSDVSLVAALQKSLEENVDILAIDFFSPIESGSINIECIKHHDLGRLRNHQARGTILIAPAGHTTTALAGTIMPKYPAKYNYDPGPFNKEPEVIGVINSNRYDLLETGEGSPCSPTFVLNAANYAYPSNYSSTYDIGAPAAQFFSYDGYTSTRGGDVNQSADAVAVTAGVVALLLEDNLYQTDIELRDRLRNGADQVNSPTYDYSNGGSSIEMARGRINCINSKNYIPTTINNIAKTDFGAWLNNTTNAWDITLKKIPISHLEYKIYSVKGDLLVKNNMLLTTKKFSINNLALASGIYFIKLDTNEGTITLKATK